MIDNLKIYLLNTSVFIISLSRVEASLKVFLLLLSIIYTSVKIIDWFKKRNNETE